VTAGGGECAEVLLDLATRIADRPLTYRVPPALSAAVGIGVRTLVPLGPRTVHGFVVGLHPCDEAGGRPLRDILDVPDPRPLFSATLLALARQVAEDTVSTLRDAVRCLVPPELSRRAPRVPRRAQVAFLDGARTPARAGARQRLILDALAAAPGGAPVAELVRVGGRGALRRLEALGAVRLADAPGADRLAPDSPRRPAGAWLPRPVPASPESPLLLWGDAAARRDWILDAVAAATRAGASSIVAVPETALAPRLVAPLREQWGGRVAEFHSDLPEARRRAAWTQMLAGEIDVAVGTRSALFAPLRRLGLIVVDEEQDPSYKADSAPRYHGRAVALARGALEGARVVLASPAPSVEVYAAVAEGRMRCVRLPPAGPAARVTVADMQGERHAGRGGLFGPALLDAIRRHLRGGGRVAVFVHRAGYGRVLVCRECGHAVRCAQCEIPMPYDGETHTIQCRVCGRTAPAPDVCPRCRGTALRWVGAGSARVHEVVRRLFPAVRTARLDRETEREFDAIAAEFASGRIRLLVGTHLLLRGRRLRPSLVGVVDADSPLYLPDFRAGERTFQELVAAVALAGGPPEPEAVIQTRMPEHPVMTALRTGLDAPLYEAELRIRREFGYPPYTYLARLIASARDRETAAALASRAAEIARARGVEVLGPAPLTGGRGGGHVRVQCLLRARDAGALRHAAQAALDGAAPPPARAHGVSQYARLAVDIDPAEVH